MVKTNKETITIDDFIWKKFGLTINYKMYLTLFKKKNDLPNILFNLTFWLVRSKSLYIVCNEQTFEYYKLIYMYTGLKLKRNSLFRIEANLNSPLNKNTPSQSFTSYIFPKSQSVFYKVINASPHLGSYPLIFARHLKLLKRLSLQYSK